VSSTLLGAAELRIQRRRIGARINFAATPAIIEVHATNTKTVFHPPCADNSDATGTSMAAVPLAV
jgi:hypothetical protein